MKRFITITVFILLLCLPVVLLILPANHFDEGQSLCLSQVLLHQECYACGMTRAIQHLIHFEFEEAFMFNMGSFIAFPAIVILYIKYIIFYYKRTATYFR